MQHSAAAVWQNIYDLKLWRGAVTAKTVSMHTYTYENLTDVILKKLPASQCFVIYNYKCLLQNRPAKS